MALIRPYRTGDERGICRLFHTVFQQELPDEVWHWKYRRDDELPTALVAEDDGRIVCHYGALRQRLGWRAGTIGAWDIVDVMCHPRYQGRGLFRRAAQRFAETFDARGGAFWYGFPGERHRQLGELVIGYQPVAPVCMLQKGLDPQATSTALHPEIFTTLPEDWDARWHRIETRFELIGRRDSAHLDWRYLQRPRKRYTLLGLSGSAALAVVGIEAQTAYLLEFLLEREETGPARVLLDAVETVCRTQGARRLEGWFAPFAWETAFLEGPGGFQNKEVDHYLECRLFDPRFNAALLAKQLYYSLGDYDVP